MTQDEPNAMEAAASTDAGAAVSGDTTADAEASAPDGRSSDADESMPDGGVAGVGDPAGDREVMTYLYWGALGVLGLLALLAVFQFYNSASAAIGVWIAPRFEPVVRAAFNLVVLLAAGIGISLVARELSG